MDFKQIEAFASVMEQGSFSKAAEALYLTQPTVSAHVSLLEKELGTQLLQRGSKQLEPTEAGLVLYTYAKKLLATRDEAVDAVAQKINSVHVITLATSTVPAKYYLPKLMTEFRAIHPDIIFDLIEGDSTKAEEVLLAGKADLGFVGYKPESKRCAAAPFAHDQLVVITPNTEYYRNLGGKFTADMLMNEPYVSREKGSGTRIESESFLRQLGIDPEKLNTVVETRSTESVKRFVSQGVGISIASKAASEDYLEFGKLLCFDFEPMSPKRQLYVIRLRNITLSKGAKDFFEYVKSTPIDDI